MKVLSWFVRPRKIWCPTLLGWLLILVAAATPCLAWWFWAEPYLCLTQREPSDILVVEGWVGEETLKAAAAEFTQGGYRWIITTGGPNGERWSSKRWTYAEIAHDRLVGFGISHDKIIMAPAPEVETQRTRESALSVLQVLAERGLQPSALNVFTRGAHARRSQLVYDRVFKSKIKIGIISWLPTGAHEGPWWHSTLRAKDLMTETVGCLYEVLLGSRQGAKQNAGSLKPAQTPAQ